MARSGRVERLCQFVAFLEFGEDVGAADELAADERLRDGLPTAVLLECCAILAERVEDTGASALFLS